ncbi:MAG TPA: Lrp/AsnC family transcriptional regulator [Alphaproteobacteria bacterium]|nr:Lrp/AsnC family transcriptional regulator [Alphaproteobacteria bacterium]
MSLDRFDIAILEALQRNCRVTNEALAASVHLSPSACLRRVQRLRREGHIAREVAILGRKAVGERLFFTILVTLKAEDRSTLDRFAAAVRDDPRIQQCHYVSGEFDLLLQVSVADMADYEALCDGLLLDDPAVARFQSVLLMRTLKSDTFVPLDRA